MLYYLLSYSSSSPSRYESFFAQICTTFDERERIFADVDVEREDSILLFGDCASLNLADELNYLGCSHTFLVNCGAIVETSYRGGEDSPMANPLH